MFGTALRCTECKTEYPLNKAIAVCEKCQGLLTVEYNYNRMQEMFTKKDLQRSATQGLWRYAKALPVSEDSVISMGEGGTPLIKSVKLEKVSRIHLKLDYINPTGSFKDRGATVIVSKAKEIGTKQIAIDSTGNAAASVSAYAARAGIKCYVFIPSYTEAEKVVQISASGATVVSVRGTRQDVHDLIEEAYRKFEWYYCGFMVSPYAIEGTKTIAYEICEQLDWNPPDWIVFPVGTGSGIVGCHKGLQELLKMGWITRLPRLVCIQAERCAPISEAFAKGLDDIQPVLKPVTVAEGLAVGKPPKGRLVLQAIKETGGWADTVTDEETLKIAHDLAGEGQFAEISSAPSVAGTIKLIESGIIDKKDKVVCELTGTGLKSSKEFAKLVSKPIEVDTKLDALITALRKD